MSLLGEIKRRKVFQVAAVYAVVAWLLVQIVATVEAPLSLPDWVDTLVIVLLAVGFPIALILSWAYDLTAAGMVRTDSVPGAPGRGSRGLELVLVAILIVAGGWIAYRELGPGGSGPDSVLPSSVAVLPFTNMSADPEDAYFAAGIHEELLNQLAKIGGLSVIAGRSVIQYADDDRPITEIARELNVGSVTDGSVSYADGRVAVRVQLVDAETGVQIWGETYDRAFAQIFAIQSQITESIAGALEAQLSPTERASIERPLTSSEEAYGLYLRASSLVRGNPAAVSASDRETALSYLDRATQLDAAFAAAYGAKARLYASAGTTTGSGLEQSRIHALALENARLAISLDPAQGDAHFSVGFLDFRSNRPLEAMRSFERAIELSPNSAVIRRGFSVLQSMMGRHDDAIANARRAMALSPNDTSMLYGLGRRFVYAGRYDDAAALLRDAIAAGGADIEDAALNLALAELVRGNPDEALEALSLSEGLWPEDSAIWASKQAIMAYLYSLLGRDADAERLIDRIRERAREVEIGDASWATAYMALGEHDRALEWVEMCLANEIFDEGYDAQTDLAWNLYRDPALETPAFQEVRQRIRLQMSGVE